MRDSGSSVDTLSSRLRLVAEKSPEHAAIIENGRVVTYEELLTSTMRLSTRLLSHDVQPGSRIALLLPNGASFAISFFSIAHLGGVVLPLNPSLQEMEIATILQDAEVALVLTVKTLEERCRHACSSVKYPERRPVLVLDDLNLDVQRQNPSSTSAQGHGQHDGPVLGLYSSGSTGRPKRIERSHFNILWETDRLVRALRLSPSDRVLGVAPFSHTNGLIRSMIASVLSGATLIPFPEFDRLAVARLIEEQRISVFIGVPFMFAILAQTRWPNSVDFSSLKICISSSAPLPRQTYLQFHKRYGIPLRQLYGTTETGSISVNLSTAPGESIESVGLPLEGISVEIFSEARGILSAGEAGEIGIKSPAAAFQYEGQPELSAESFRDNYFFPGDIGVKDAEGRIRLLGRKTLFINRGGFKVNPYEIEGIIECHPKVMEAAVVGVGTEYGDQKIKAIIVTREACQEREIIDFCRDKLADFKVPSIVEFRTELPKSSTGKTLRAAL